MLTFKGEGLINTLINKLPVELHFSGYQYCGPGTKLQKRIQRGDLGINKLDSACRDHDISYSNSSALEDRHKADWQLENRAWERVKSKDASLGEKAAAWVVTNAMKAKRKLGMGIKKKKQFSFKRDFLNKITKTLSKKKHDNLNKSSMLALHAARNIIKKIGRENVKVPRIIPIDLKTGGFLPLLPIMGALGALGSLAGGARAVTKTINDAKNAKKNLEEQKRHNKTMEFIGKGLYLRKNKRGGYGLFLKKQKNFQ